MTEINLIASAGFAYILAMVCYIGFLFFKNKFLGRFATFLLILGVCTQLIGFIIRWHDFCLVNDGGVLQTIPITNLYESLQFFALLLILIYLGFEFKTDNKAVGVFASAFAGATVLFIDTIGASNAIKPLVPALQSNWLLAHVTLSFIAYVFFAISAITAFLYLVLSSKKRNQWFYIFWTVSLGVGISFLLALIFDGIIACFNGSLSKFRLFSATLYNQITSVKLMFVFLSMLTITITWYSGLLIKKIFLPIQPKLEKLDSWTYKFAVTGFIIFTIGGLIFGAVWAEQAWGRYWSWDPKETWAFVTWVVYGIYLHGRLHRKWNPILANVLAFIGFLLTIFTYLGVNLLLSGLHSYGSL